MSNRVGLIPKLAPIHLEVSKGVYILYVTRHFDFSGERRYPKIEYKHNVIFFPINSDFKKPHLFAVDRGMGVISKKEYFNLCENYQWRWLIYHIEVSKFKYGVTLKTIAKYINEYIKFIVESKEVVQMKVVLVDKKTDDSHFIYTVGSYPHDPSKIPHNLKSTPMSSKKKSSVSCKGNKTNGLKNMGKQLSKNFRKLI